MYATLRNRPSFSKKQLLVIALIFAAIGGYTLYNTFAYEPRGLIHTNNTLIRLASDQKIYLIENDKLRLVSDVALKSYGYTLSDVRPATAEDALRPLGTPLELADGTVVKDGDRQYVVEKSGGRLKSRLIKNINFLAQLNAKDSSVIDATLSKLPKDFLPPLHETTLAKKNPDGTVVLSGSGTKYLIENGKKRPIPTYGAYLTNRISQKLTTAENEADQALPVGAPLELREGSLVKGSGPTDYVLEKSKNRKKTLLKRPIRSDEVLLTLGYHKSDVIRIPDVELNKLPVGAPLPESAAGRVVVIAVVKPGEDTKVLSEEYLKDDGKLRFRYPTWFSMEVPFDRIEYLKSDSRIQRVEGNGRYYICPPQLKQEDCEPTLSSSLSPAGSAYGCDWDGDGIADQFNTSMDFCTANGGRWAPAAPPAPPPPPPPPAPAPAPPPTCFPSPGNDYCSAPRPPAPQPPQPPPLPPAPPPPPPVPPSPGAPAPNIYTWYFIGGNSWSYGVDGASRCEVHLSSGGYQPFIPSLGGTFTVTAGNGGANGQLKCWNNNVGPTVSGWAGPSANPTPPVPPGGVAPVIQTWAFIGGNSWSYRVSNSDYCEVRLSNGGYQPFVPSLGGTFTVTAGGGGLKGQLKCWNGGTGPVVSNWTGPSANPTPPPPAPAPVPPTPGAPAPVINTWQFLSGNSWGYNVSLANRCEVYLSSGGYQPFIPSLGGTFTVTAGDGGLNGQLKCWNHNVGPTVSDWAGPTNPTAPPSPSPGPAPLNPPFPDWYPTIKGQAKVGSILQVVPGRWKGSVDSFAHQWVTCTSVDFTGYPRNCTNISGARATTYRIVSANANKRIAVRETATNRAGSVSVFSLATEVVTGSSPVPTPPPLAISLTSDQGTSVVSGAQVTLRWSTIGGATVCGGSSTPSNDKWNGPRAVAGSLEVGPLTVTTNFRLECSNGINSAPPASITINVTGPPPAAGPNYFRRIGWTSRGAGQPVAVLDTGVNRHPLLNVAPAGFNCIPGDSSSPTDDTNGHGTRVAGVIGARGNGVDTPMGIAPGTQIHPIKVAGNDGWASDESMVCALEQARAAGLRLANISFAGPGQNDDGNCGPTILYKAICDFPGLVFIAAGNSGAGISGYSPGASDRAITVTAMNDSDGRPGGLGGPNQCGDSDDAPAVYSNYADGNEGTHTVSAPSCILTTYGPDGSAFAGGTSISTPVVAGMAALCGCSPSASFDPAYYFNVTNGLNYGPLVRF